MTPSSSRQNVFDLLVDLRGCTREEAKAKGEEFYPVIQQRKDYQLFDLSLSRLLVTTEVYQWSSEMGNRPFDMPMLDRGTICSPGDREISYAVQPRSNAMVEASQLGEFRREAAQLDEIRRIAKATGYNLLQLRLEHLRVYQGQVKLIVPWIACKPRRITEVIAEITDAVLIERFYIGEMLRNLSEFPNKVMRLLKRFNQALVFELEEGNLLNLWEGLYYPRGGFEREFDAPILDKGHWTGPYGYAYSYYVTPFIEPGVTPKEVEEFLERLKGTRFRIDIGYFNSEEHLGRYNGDVVLLDPDAVIMR